MAQFLTSCPRCHRGGVIHRTGVSKQRASLAVEVRAVDLALRVGRDEQPRRLRDDGRRWMDKTTARGGDAQEVCPSSRRAACFGGRGGCDRADNERATASGRRASARARERASDRPTHPRAATTAAGARRHGGRARRRRLDDSTTRRTTETKTTTRTTRRHDSGRAGAPSCQWGRWRGRAGPRWRSRSPRATRRRPRCDRRRRRPGR